MRSQRRRARQRIAHAGDLADHVGDHAPDRLFDRNRDRLASEGDEQLVKNGKGG
jgi:hypothetical protein